MTYEEARQHHLTKLHELGWVVKVDLKIPHATHPTKNIRLWFRAQAVYCSEASPFKGHGHSLGVDLRRITTLEIIQRAERRSNSMSFHLCKLTFGGVKSRSRSGVPVDYIIRVDKYKKLYRAALLHGVLKTKQGLFVRYDFLVAMKMVAGRSKDEEDIKTLILLLPSRIVRMRNTVRKYLGDYAADDFDQFVRLARWEKKESMR